MGKILLGFVEWTRVFCFWSSRMGPRDQADVLGVLPLQTYVCPIHEGVRQLQNHVHLMYTSAPEARTHDGKFEISSRQIS